MLGLRDLSTIIEKEILIAEHDVKPVYLPNIKEIRIASTSLVDVLYHQFDDFAKVGNGKHLKKSIPVLKKLLSFVRSDIKVHGRWSFWHFMAIGIVTATAHEELIRKNKNRTIDLNNQETWASPDWQMATLFFYFSSHKLYKNHMTNFIKVQARDDVDVETLSRLLVRKIKTLNGEV